MRIKLPVPSTDHRGTIQNLVELDALGHLPIRGAAIITSRARTTRSNHYHKTDGHWLYVISGLLHYWERNLDEPHYPSAPGIFRPGEMVYTGPLVLHRTYFPEETMLLSLSLRPRDRVSHEDDVVRDGTK